MDAAHQSFDSSLEIVPIGHCAALGSYVIMWARIEDFLTGLISISALTPIDDDSTYEKWGHQQLSQKLTELKRLAGLRKQDCPSYETLEDWCLGMGTRAEERGCLVHGHWNPPNESGACQIFKTIKHSMSCVVAAETAETISNKAKELDAEFNKLIEIWRNCYFELKAVEPHAAI